MIFNSVTYLLFLAVAVSLYWVLPRRPRLWLIFLASLSFYGFWRVEFLPVMMASALTDYFAARGIHRNHLLDQLHEGPQRRSGRRQRLHGKYGSIGFYLEDQAVEVGGLLDPGRLDIERYAPHR